MWKWKVGIGENAENNAKYGLALCVSSFDLLSGVIIMCVICADPSTDQARWMRKVLYRHSVGEYSSEGCNVYHVSFSSRAESAYIPASERWQISCRAKIHVGEEFNIDGIRTFC